MIRENNLIRSVTEKVGEIGSTYVKIRSFFEMLFGVICIIVSIILLFMKIYPFAIFFFVLGVVLVLFGKFLTGRRYYKSLFGGTLRVVDSRKFKSGDTDFEPLLPNHS